MLVMRSKKELREYLDGLDHGELVDECVVLAEACLSVVPEVIEYTMDYLTDRMDEAASNEESLDVSLEELQLGYLMSRFKMKDLH